jgi:hypothetical protein
LNNGLIKQHPTLTQERANKIIHQWANSCFQRHRDNGNSLKRHMTKEEWETINALCIGRCGSPYTILMKLIAGEIEKSEIFKFYG